MNDADILNELIATAKTNFSQSATPADLENAKAQFLGKSGRITEFMKGMAQLSVEEKKSRGAAVNLAKQAIETALNERRQALAKAELEKQLKAEALDVTLPGCQRVQGGLHPVSLTLERIEDIFGSMGFDVAQGPEIETDWFNFTALNTPEDHPARSMHDTFYVEGGTENAPNLLRTHTSPMQIRYAVQHVKKHRALIDAGGRMPEIRVIAPGRTYRVDSDATHSPMFHQCEGLWIGENVSFKDLKYVFTYFCRTFFESNDLVLRFRPSFFPFTEPSAEIDIQFQSGPLSGQWLEVAGSGQVHPNVVRNMGLDPEKYIGFAFGMGPDRLTMLRYGVNDLRLFFDGDIRFLSQFQS
ncbi:MULTISPECIES: phenylalanine--tRNA ligase subunit alpha [unclassified Polaromonas]|uniref:phenylalanine--tRNA ligase subunit alpha n=1 Tax=unclassified Polaromonas TaxID=2638319 RepID=UPI0018CB176A|nr:MULTISPECIES: phenylalanine--tRNA ligase subunit alpha [unclassified Polaromonas]MBG6070646.1 phenylalanyl-tRNA synthetase alpha chain [Polaromonas sp. CG_9.7]MBG6112644.1 phenylalanyl-tRNA synthetase alpha chain [Polaromonas sp. CG_9.2]MDH6184294.1 phenylalanyl-tRNA synthetase alpha chain [Polaromonas sp. CG_23.6]